MRVHHEPDAAAQPPHLEELLQVRHEQQQQLQREG